MDIKRTRILHKRHTLAEWSSDTLRQGEFGFLLSDDKTQVLEVRVGTHDVYVDDRIVGVPWENAIVLASLSTDQDDKVTIDQLNEVITYVDQLNTQVAKHNEILNTFEDTDTRIVISEGVGEGTIHVDYWSKNDVITPGGDIKIPGWDNLVNIALGRTKSHVYVDLNDERFLTDVATPNKFHIGDIVYFEDTNTPDRWVTQVLDYPLNGSLYVFSLLKVEAPVLTDYIKTTEADAKFVTKDTLNNLNVDIVGGENEYIESVKQQGGKVVVVSRKLPDIDNKIHISANNVRTEIKQYVDDAIGETDLDDNGQRMSVVKHVSSNVQRVSTEVSSVRTTVQQHTQSITSLSQTTQELTSQIGAIVSTQNNLTSRVTKLEQICGTGSGTGLISVVKLGGNALPIDSSDNSVNIDSISTDLLVQGNKKLVFDCEDN